MILRNEGIIFIHIPKTAGTSIERALTGEMFTTYQEPDYDRVWGWCPDRKIWMQHATPRQLLDLGLVKECEWDRFFKFTVTRNPFDRAVSDYYFLCRQPGIHGSFAEMPEGLGRWRHILGTAGTHHYRGDHTRSQSEYIMLDQHLCLDHVGQFEDLDTTFDLLDQRLGRRLPRPHAMAARKWFRHYSHFYAAQEIEVVRTRYRDDLQMLGYEFDDRRSRRTRALRLPRRLAGRLDAGLASLRAARSPRG